MRYIPLLLAFVSFNILASNNTSFRWAKARTYQVHGERGKTLYCECDYKKGKILGHKSCGFKYDKYKKRAYKLEWEHVVPANAFGMSFREWHQGHEKCVTRKGKKYKGRKCVAKVNKLFRAMEGDLYNLYPAVGAINAVRSNFSMASVKGGKIFGGCEVKIKDRKIEPPNQVKGDIARIYMYMNYQYPGKGIISKKNKKLFDYWDKKDPVSKRECEINKKIESIQGNKNPFVYYKC